MAEHEERRSTADTARIAGVVVVLLLLLLFALDNRDSVRVGFVFADHETPLIWVIVVTAALGVLLGRLWSWASRRSR